MRKGRDKTHEKRSVSGGIPPTLKVWPIIILWDIWKIIENEIMEFLNGLKKKDFKIRKQKMKKRINNGVK